MSDTRATLPFDSLVNDFLLHAEEEEPRLAKYLGMLEKEGRLELAGILGRFDYRKRGKLDAHQRLSAYRILVRLRKPVAHALQLTNQVLDYLDLNANAIMEESELALCLEIFEIFAHADSDNDTLSELELEMLYAVLRHLDGDDSRFLEIPERLALRKALNDPETFLANQRMENPLIQALLRR